ncbi:MAG: sulfite exporter TauE/SafE family protein, partial [Elainellaceae cyanobacterium]
MDISTYLWLSLTSMVSWFFSTLAGGGSSLILIPVLGLLLGAAAVPPVITVGGVLGSVERIVAYRQYICWRLVAWEMPGSIAGACCGAFALSQIKTPWLSVAIALFLIGSAVGYLFRGEAASFTVQPWYFLPAGFAYALLSGLIGSMGPILAPFYLNYGLTKEELLATQATNRAAVHLIKMLAYTYLGILTLPTLGLGVLVGVSAFPGNLLGQKMLERIS